MTLLQKESSRFKFIPLRLGRISPNWAHVDHPCTEFDKSATFFRQFYLRQIAENEVDKFLVFLLPEPLDKAVTSERLAQAVRSQAVLREAEIEERGDRNGR